MATPARRGRLKVGHRPPLTATHRGRVVIRAVVAGLGVGVVALALSPSSGSNSDEDPYMDQSLTVYTAPTPPNVAAAPANPMRPYAGVNAVSDATQEDEEAAETGSDEARQRLAKLREAAAQAATRWGTYSYHSTAAEFVDAIPYMTLDARAALVKTVAPTWDAIMAQQVVATATPVAADPSILADDGTTVEVAVMVTQQVKTKDSAVLAKSRAYQITLQIRQPNPTPTAIPETGDPSPAADPNSGFDMGDGSTAVVVGVSTIA